METAKDGCVTQAASNRRSLLSIVLDCHNYQHSLFGAETTAEYVPFHLHLEPLTAQIGFIPHHVLQAIKEDDSGTFAHNRDWTRVGLSPRLDTFQKRTDAINNVATRWKEAGHFRSALDGWRREMYAIYSDDRHPYAFYRDSPAERPNERAFELERAACALFGLATFGVHLTAYTDAASSSDEAKIWTPRRAQDKATWPGFLDNSVAGGITSGDSPWESVIRECWEEAGLSEEVVRPRLKQVGVLTYVYRTPEGYLQPEIEYVYDLPLPLDVRPHPVDGEAEDFQLWTFDQIRTRMQAGEFKPNCALVIIDFLIRHGVITAETEPRYMQVVSLLHNDLGLPGL
ncbi:unnamed protein product [Parajaminaea phylloscopi]